MAARSEKDLIKQRLNRETGKLSWHELQPHFARGAVIRVGQDLDLLEVAAELSLDNQAQFQQWLTAGQVARVSDQQAADWYRLNPMCWTTVVAPWVLVQAVND